MTVDKWLGNKFGLPVDSVYRQAYYWCVGSTTTTQDPHHVPPPPDRLRRRVLVLGERRQDLNHNQPQEPAITATKTIAEQINDLVERKTQLHAEMLGAHGKTDTQWYRDRANEMASLNRWHAMLLQRRGRLAGVVG